MVQGAQGRAGAAGDVDSAIQVGGLRRVYHLHVPPSYDGTEPTPLVLVFHGRMESGKGMAKMTGFNTVSDQEGFIVVYPEAVDRHWNDGRGATLLERQQVDDVRCVSVLIAHLTQTLNIDQNRIYATGISNGAMFVQRLACELSEQLAAIGPVAGTMATNIATQCAPKQPVSVVESHGTTDVLVPWDGGEIPIVGGKVLSVPETIARWVQLNGCPSSPHVTDEPDRDPSDGTRVRREAYGPCRTGSEVALYVVEGGGHSWPGGPGSHLPFMHHVSRDIRTTEVVWDFFKKHPKTLAKGRQKRWGSNESGPGT